MERSIGEKTKVPIGWVFALLSASGTGIILAVTSALWVGKLEAKTMAMDEKVIELKEAHKSNTTVLQSIDQRLSRIEGALRIKE